MFLSSLELTNFRNYEQLNINFSPESNILFGANAQGKTNIIEAIYLVCFSRSFKSLLESEIVTFNKNHSLIIGHFESDLKIKRDVIINYFKGQGKSILIDRKKLNRFSELIGQFPVVIFTPDDFKITIGAPAERRRLVDTILSQVSNAYLKTLQQFIRILKQRNKLLSDAAINRSLSTASLEPWNENFVKFGSAIVQFRHIFVSEFSPLLSKIYMDLNLSNESLIFSYKPSFKYNDISEIESNFIRILEKKKNLERLRGLSLVGPQRDDFSFKIDNNELKKYGSRGQHKTVLIALKIAEYNYLKNKIKETPIILLDDLFSDLDPAREEKIVEKIQDVGQIFITTTRSMDAEVFDFSNSKQFEVRDNNVYSIEK